MTEVVEQDTSHSEDTLNIAAFIRDGMPAEDSCYQEGYLYNRKVFNGWMKQPSACCAAASVAGAFNALALLHRSDEGALTHSDILQIYDTMFSDIISKHKISYERRLGASLDDFLLAVEVELKKMGREIGGSKGSNATRSSIMNVIKRLSRARLMATKKVLSEKTSEVAPSGLLM